jgi:hypothetical protein
MALPAVTLSSEAARTVEAGAFTGMSDISA